MKNVSPEGGSPQESLPEIIPFDAAKSGERDGGDGGDNGLGDTPPYAMAVGGLLIRAPRGIQPVVVGYDLWAVEMDEMDGEEDVLAAHPMSGTVDSLKKLLAVAIEMGQKPALPRGVLATATHLVINDHLGREVYRHGLAKQAA